MHDARSQAKLFAHNLVDAKVIVSDTEPSAAVASEAARIEENPSEPQQRRPSSLNNEWADGRLMIPIERAHDHVTLSPHVVMVGNTGTGGIPRLRLLLMQEDRRTVRVGVGDAPATDDNRQVDEIKWREIGVVEFDLPLAVSVINQLAERMERFPPDVLQRFGIQLDEGASEASKDAIA